MQISRRKSNQIEWENLHSTKYLLRTRKLMKHLHQRPFLIVNFSIITRICVLFNFLCLSTIQFWQSPEITNVRANACCQQLTAAMFSCRNGAKLKCLDSWSRLKKKAEKLKMHTKQKDWNFIFNFQKIYFIQYTQVCLFSLTMHWNYLIVFQERRKKKHKLFLSITVKRKQILKKQTQDKLNDISLAFCSTILYFVCSNLTICLSIGPTSTDGQWNHI